MRFSCCFCSCCLVVGSGHGAIIHAATVEDNVLVGMGATLLDGVTVSQVLLPVHSLKCWKLLHHKSLVPKLEWRSPSCLQYTLLMCEPALSGVQVQKGSVVAAGAIVTPGKTVPSGEVPLKHWLSVPLYRLIYQSLGYFFSCRGLMR